MIIDQEFKGLIPPLSAEEYAGLEASILAEGCRDALIVWGDILVDGHNRYEICEKHGIKYQTMGRPFANRTDAQAWIIRNQFSRRNLSAYQRSELALKLEPLIREKAKENQKGGQGGVLLPQNSAKAIETRAELARIAGVSHDTIMKVKKIQEEAPEKIREATRAGDLTINAAYRMMKKEEAKQKVSEAVVNTDIEQDISGKFRIFYADPPWKYATDQHSNIGTVQHTVIGTHYTPMATDDICALPIPDMAKDDAVIFLWATSPLLLHALRVMQAWGFVYKAQMIWDKVKHNVGHYVSVRHEILLIGTRGACTPDVKTLFDSVYSEERTEHSRKPEYFRKVIDTIYPIGRRVELFAREPAPGWVSWGNQL